MAASWPTAGNPEIALSDRQLRTGYQFSYDVGAASANGGDEVRFLYTVRDDKENRLYVRGSFCDYALTHCDDAPEWGTTPGNLRLSGDQFNPSVRAFPGFFNIPPVWKVTYLSRQDDPNGNKVSLEQGNLIVLPTGTRAFIPFPLVTNQLVCGDSRVVAGGSVDAEVAGHDRTLGGCAQVIKCAVANDPRRPAAECVPIAGEGA